MDKPQCNIFKNRVLFAETQKLCCPVKIGIFDSGVGGLTVLKEAYALMPQNHFVYFGDSARFPYGTKSPKTLIKYSIENSLFLLDKGVDVILIACNTASSCALEPLQRHFSVPIIDVITPAIRKGLQATHNGRIGIIGTTALVQSKTYQKRLKEESKNDLDITLFPRACPLLISLIEENFIDTAIKKAILDFYLSPLRKHGIDTLILACTHFPLIHEDIQKAIGDTVSLINPSKACAEEVFNLYKKANSSASDKSTPGQIDFYVSDDPKRFKRAGEAFLGIPIKKVHVI